MQSVETFRFIPWIPALAALICGACCWHKKLRVYAAPVSILAIATAFLISFGLWGAVKASEPKPVKAFSWIHIGDLTVDFGYLIDPLTLLMLFVVTGVGALVTIYAAGYMAGDRGYARFFAYVSLFIFAMTTLVMADNLVLLYLGWEGVGLCSYLLIGFNTQKPAAVAAAKKAFIVNRIGDLGFALGIFLCFQRYGTVALWTGDGDAPGIIEMARRVQDGTMAGAAADLWIPFLLMLGAFGKSAQIPLHVWLPDAMEGPTPVSALIHAATMVTAGVYMIARLHPVFALCPYALPTVATVGAITALFAGSIAACQCDLKKVFAYSTISQLGYMFLGVGVLSTVGAMFHLFTHAFFKALLFLTAGNVMHAMAGQLDMRRISGLRRKMPLTCLLMLAGCLALAGAPLTSGFFSKDLILADALQMGVSRHDWRVTTLAILAIATALLTAYYTFRLWFRVFLGVPKYEMGPEHAPPKEADGLNDTDIRVEHHHEPHEMNWLMNGPLLVLAAGSIAAGFLFQARIAEMVNGSLSATPAAAVQDAAAHLAADAGADDHGVRIFGLPIHTFMIVLSVIVSLGGIGLAAYFHWLNRAAADRMAAAFPEFVRALQNKYYVDELYEAALVRPLRTLGNLFYVVDRLLIEGLVALVGFLPRLAGLSLQTTQRGFLQGYGLGMAVGVGVVLLIVIVIAK